MTRHAERGRSDALKAITDHGALREWVELRGGIPATDTRASGGGRGAGWGGDAVGELSIHFPGYNDDGLVDISWDEFYEQFERNNLALLYDDTKAEDGPTEFSFTSRSRVKEGVFEFGNESR